MTAKLHRFITAPLHRRRIVALHHYIISFLHYITPFNHSITTPFHVFISSPLHHCATSSLHHCTTAPLHHCIIPSLFYSTILSRHLRSSDSVCAKMKQKKKMLFANSYINCKFKTSHTKVMYEHIKWCTKTKSIRQNATKRICIYHQILVIDQQHQLIASVLFLQ